MGFEPGEQKASPSINFIAGTMEARIHAGEYPHGQWLPTERELAEEFKVSRATIRLVLGELARRNLVLRANGCRPLVMNSNGAVTNGTSQARCSLGLWISGDPGDVGGAMTVRGIHSVLDPDAYRLVVAHHSGATLEALIESEAQALARFIRDKDIEGLILWYFGDRHNLPALMTLRAANIPMIFVDRKPPVGFEADHVGVQNERAAQTLVQHLIEQGHRHIAHITNSEPASTVAERLAGYRKALEAARLPYRPELVLPTRFLELEKNPSAGESPTVDHLLNQPVTPTAVFAVNDYTARWLITALRARGMRVPEDMAVAGFDDEERWKPDKPFVTTIRAPFEQMGTEAARLLLERLQSGPVSAYRHILLEAPLVVRGSTRCHPVGV